MSLITFCFEQLRERFAEVIFVPGNHDLWVRQGDFPTSVDKYFAVLKLAQDHDIWTKPFHHGELSIVPLQSWYDFSFGEPNEELRLAWMDFTVCRWPEEFNITEFFLGENAHYLQTDNKLIISLSHFLPRIDIMPQYIPQSKRFLYPVLGTALLDKQIRNLGSAIHVYGHSHVNQTVSIDGITYINNAFGYPTETRIAAKKLRCIYPTTSFN